MNSLAERIRRWQYEFEIADLGEAADALEAQEKKIAELERDNAVLRDAINDALPWMIKLRDYIGNGTKADPMGRCNAILKMRIAVEKRDD